MALKVWSLDPWVFLRPFQGVPRQKCFVNPLGNGLPFAVLIDTCTYDAETMVDKTAVREREWGQ